MRRILDYSLLIGVVLAVLAICFFVFKIPDFYPQIVAILASAFLGAGITAWITKSLLKSQQKSEEEKEKNIKIYENKIDVYSDFISKLWDTMKDGNLTEEELRDIRSEVFNRLIFYLGINDIKVLGEKINKITELRKNLQKDEDGKVFNKASGGIITSYSEITEVLRNDINKNNDNATEELSALWRNFALPPILTAVSGKEEMKLNQLSRKDDNAQSITTPATVESLEEPVQNTPNKMEYNQAWHFAMLGDEQLDAIGEGKINELSLLEYEEEWRTNLVKQVGDNDIVFLFRRGGFGYIGAFKPLGWRIFDYNEEKETIHRFNKQEQVVSISDEDVNEFDIYGGRDDGADLCTNLIVEPLKYIPDGVGNPGGVYRRTISRYDASYASTLYEWFSLK